MQVNFVYTITLITNKYELLNEFNQLVQYKFKALQCYIYPNEHPMSLVLDSVNDESEYSLDDRKFYSQSFNITLRGYIITPSDFNVTHLPSRKIIMFDGDASYKKKKHNKNKFDKVKDTYNKSITINCYLEGCKKISEFIIDCSFTLEQIETTNIYDFVIKVNDELVDFSLVNSLEIFDGDKITIEIEKDEMNKDSVLSLIGEDKSVVLDKDNFNESPLDDEVDEEIIDVR